VSARFWVRGAIRFMALRLTSRWCAVWRLLSRVRLAGESSAVGGVCLGDRPVRVYCLHGLGFGSDVTVVVRLGEGLD
jgi:hypothetical protein